MLERSRIDTGLHRSDVGNRFNQFLFDRLISVEELDHTGQSFRIPLFCELDPVVDYVGEGIHGIVEERRIEDLSAAQGVHAPKPLGDGPGARGFPVHIVLTFDGQTVDEALSNPATSPLLYIFPTKAYLDLYEEAGDSAVSDQVLRLETLIEGAPERTEPPGDPMPLLPPPFSTMNRWVQFSDLAFGVGTGVRYVSDSPSRQAVGVWANDTNAYYYQGYYRCGGCQTYYHTRPYYRPYTYYGAHYGYNYNCYHGSCYRH